MCKIDCAACKYYDYNSSEECDWCNLNHCETGICGNCEREFEDLEEATEIYNSKVEECDKWYKTHLEQALKIKELEEKSKKNNSRQLANEDIIFLKKLREDLLLQEDSIEYNDGNAFPRFWGIMEDSYIYRETSYFGGDEVFVSPHHCEEFEDIKEAKDFYQDAVDELEDEYYTKEYFEDSVIDFDDLKNFLHETDIDDSCEIQYKEKTEQLCQTTGAFLTKQDAKDYIQKYSYNHNNPRTYAMTGYRNFRLEKLLNIIKNTDWEKLKNE